MTITLINPLRVQSSDIVVTSCTTCDSLAYEAQPWFFVHMDFACKECFGTGLPCPYPEMHGVFEYTAPGVGRVPCREVTPADCRWCLRVLDAAELPCPDHESCCGCCPGF